MGRVAVGGSEGGTGLVAGAAGIGVSEMGAVSDVGLMGGGVKKVVVILGGTTGSVVIDAKNDSAAALRLLLLFIGTGVIGRNKSLSRTGDGRRAGVLCMEASSRMGVIGANISC